MKAERTVRECTYRPSPTSAPCVVLIDPDPLSAKRYSHNARWTWSEEEGIFFATLVMQAQMAYMADCPNKELLGQAVTHLLNQIDDKGGQRKDESKKKRLTPKRKRA